MSEKFDYVIVGAGSAGCVMALRLAEAGHTVCVLEAGPDDRRPTIHVPAGYIRNVSNPALTWAFQCEPVPGTSRRSSLVQPKVVGGGSSINGMVYGRGQAADYDGWAAAGNTGWSYQDVLPYFKKAEMRIGAGDDAYRGRNGRLTVSDLAIKDPLCDLFIQAANQCGYPAGDDYNGAAQEGVNCFQFTIDTRGPVLRRMSSARAHLRPALKTGRVALRTDSPAVKVLFEGRRAVGVRYRAGGLQAPERQVRANREVIVSTGSINTPRLLQVSGIGPEAHLRTLGVEVVHDSPGVGANFTDHYALRVAAKLRGVKTFNERGRGLRLALEIAKWAVGNRSSILGSGPALMCLFTRSRPGMARPDVQMSFTPGSYQESVLGLLDRYPGVTCGGYHQRPESRGYVMAVSRDIAVPPKVQPNYLSAEADRAAMLFVVRTARRLLGSPAFAPHFVEEVFPGKEVQSDDEILDFARQRGGTCFHPVSSARMGPDGDPMAVVDPQARVRGVNGLRVVDASIMPSIISGNTNAPVMMMAEKISQEMAGAR